MSEYSNAGVLPVHSLGFEVAIDLADDEYFVDDWPAVVVAAVFVQLRK